MSAGMNFEVPFLYGFFYEMKALKKAAVLITGATSGIGLELAKLFAKDGNDMVIVARDEQTLNKVSDELLKLGAGKVTVISKDLSLPGKAEEVFMETSQSGIEIGTLVNDAGVGQRGLFSDIPLDKDLEIIHLNIISLLTLTKLYLKEMLERKSGRILQLASVASYQPTPLLSVYAATKAFVLSLTDSLGNELKDSGVSITALIPGATDTDFFNKADMENTVAAHHDPEDPALVAKIGYEALRQGKLHATAPGVKKEILMSSLSPNKRVAEKARKQMEEEKE
jgi:short-subunit dehydrogenase